MKYFCIGISVMILHGILFIIIGKDMQKIEEVQLY